ncbi:MAG: phosphotransferase, partial [Oscillospiraceae bacterium]|nr:phosphotransferase [Oscillospiraceae bacterium]
MDRMSDFLREFQASLDTAALPGAARGYRLESCLANRDRDGVWLVRRKRDGERFVLRVSREGELREEFEMLSRLPPDLAGRMPAAVDFFEEDGAQYLVRSYLPGQSLAEAWEAREQPESGCIRLGRQLCALLDRLHRLSPPVIHRDVKPENIILSPQGEPCLIDFGIARSYDPERDADTACMGTRSTAAPEQYGFSQSDQRTDLYALGVTLRWMVTGSYRAADLEEADCSEGLKRFLRKAAAFDPADRYPTAAAMGAALARLERPLGKRLRPLLLACLLAAALAAGWGIADRYGPVDFGSSLLEEAVRMELDMPEGPVARRDLERVRRLAVVGREVLDEERQFRCNLCIYLDGVSQYDAPRGDISDISILADMPNLTTLYLCRQEISDFSALEGLPLREHVSNTHILADETRHDIECR